MTKKLISGVHHTCLKCKDEKAFKKAVDFYKNLLGFEVFKDFDFNGKPAIMLKCGDGIIEIFSDAEVDLPTGIIQHFALKTEDADACAKAIKDAGYKVTLEPQDLVLADKKAPFPVRVAFCIGPVGEIIELFCERLI